ncbi:MAG: hypothetical protein ACOC1K_07080 [Nanoarchaeota archaeon]
MIFNYDIPKFDLEDYNFKFSEQVASVVEKPSSENQDPLVISYLYADDKTEEIILSDSINEVEKFYFNKDIDFFYVDDKKIKLSGFDCGKLMPERLVFSYEDESMGIKDSLDKLKPQSRVITPREKNQNDYEKAVTFNSYDEDLVLLQFVPVENNGRNNYENEAQDKDLVKIYVNENSKYVPVACNIAKNNDKSVLIKIFDKYLDKNSKNAILKYDGSIIIEFGSDNFGKVKNSILKTFEK